MTEVSYGYWQGEGRRVLPLCGFRISERDPHPLCIACMRVQHAQTSFRDSSCCQHCSAMPARTLEWRLRVLAASKAEPWLSDSATKLEPVKASMSWYKLEDFPPLFDQLLDSVDECGGGEAEEDDILDLLSDENEEDGSDIPTRQCPPSRHA